MSKSILMIAFHFPPAQASSGVLRSLAFSRYLSENGYEVYLLTAKIRADTGCQEANLELIPPRVKVIRTKALDASKDLSIRGWYPGLLDVPDRFSSWFWTGYLAAARLIKESNINVIFSTYPIATAHLLAIRLASRFDLPLIADFRDPMIMDSHPPTLLRRWAHKRIEKSTVERADLAVFTNDFARVSYETKYPKLRNGRVLTVPNGYEEALFERNSGSEKNCYPAGNKKITIVHSGSLYEDHRDPTLLFNAVGALIDDSDLAVEDLHIVLRASGHEKTYLKLIAKYNLEETIELAPTIPYREAIQEITDASGLLVIQGSSCDAQIPAKIYEYFRTGRPVFGILGSNGATAGLMSDVGIENYAVFDDEQSVKAELRQFLLALKSGSVEKYLPKTDVAEYSRTTGAALLCSAIDDVVR